MRRPGMSSPPVLPGKYVYTLVLYNNNNNNDNINSDNNLL